jgi:hypothetical protein
VLSHLKVCLFPAYFHPGVIFQAGIINLIIFQIKRGIQTADDADGDRLFTGGLML